MWITFGCNSATNKLGKCPSQFSLAQGDVYKLLVFFWPTVQNAKITEDKEKAIKYPAAVAPLFLRCWMFDFTPSWPSTLSQITFKTLHGFTYLQFPLERASKLPLNWPEMIRDIPQNNHWDLLLQQPCVCLLRETTKRVFNPSAVSPRAVPAKDQHLWTSACTNPEKILPPGFCLFSFQAVLPSDLSPCGSTTARSKLLPLWGRVWVLTGGGWISRWV